jgi:hypothetical protein
VPGAPGAEGPFSALGNPTCSDGIDNDCDGATDEADSDCMAQQLPDMSQWVGQWFKTKGSMKCNTFNELNASFLKENNTRNGYMHIWSWNPNTGKLHFDYYRQDEGIWNASTDILHFLAGTAERFLFWYDGYDESAEASLTGEFKGKIKDGVLKSATMSTLGGVYTEAHNGSPLHSAGEQTITGKTIDESKVPVPVSVRLSH